MNGDLKLYLDFFFSEDGGVWGVSYVYYEKAFL